MSFKDRFLKAENEAWKGNVGALEEIDDPNVIIHECVHPIGMLPDLIGVEAHKQYILGAIRAVSNPKQEWLDFIEQGDTAAVHYKSSGNMTGQMPGLPPPRGQETTMDLLMMLHLKKGKVTEYWMYGTSTGLT
jgi:hypothetical protein